MVLNETKATETIENPLSKKDILSAKNYESQFRVFTEEMSNHELLSESYWNSLLNTMKKRSDKKFKRVIEFARYPLPIVQLSDSILNDYFKVFDGKNRYFNVTGERNIQKLNDWIDLKNPTNWIEEKAKSVYKNKPISFVVVDKDKNNVPYLIYIDSTRLVDAKFKNKEGELEYISFIHSVKNEEGKTAIYYGVYDDLKYYVFKRYEDSENLILVSDQEHQIGYCPARCFTSTTTNSKNYFKRRIAFSSSLSKMEDWTMFDIYRNYVDHYAPFPVTEAPKKKCPNPDCVDGKVEQEVPTNENRTEFKTIHVDCETCDGGANDGTHIFPGTHIGIKVQSDKDVNDGSKIFRMIYPETDKLKYVPEKLEGLETDIRYKTVGINDLTTNKAFNETQIKGSFASMESILLRVKTELDVLYSWIVKTAGLIIYPNYKINVESNFGTEFYLVSEDDLQKRFEKAKEIGLPSEEQFNIYRQLVETKYKGNSTKLTRTLMLLDLDPLPMYSIDDCVVLKKESVIDDFDFIFKVNFLKYISRFEAEQAPITVFGSLLDYWTRIELIKNILSLYNEENIEAKNKRNNPNDDDDDKKPQVTQEQLEAQANLRGSVGGVQGILQIQASVASGVTSIDSAIATMVEIYGFGEETAKKILGTGVITPPDPSLED